MSIDPIPAATTSHPPARPLFDAAVGGTFGAIMGAGFSLIYAAVTGKTKLTRIVMPTTLASSLASAVVSYFKGTGAGNQHDHDHVSAQPLNSIEHSGASQSFVSRLKNEPAPDKQLQLNR